MPWALAPQNSVAAALQKALRTWPEAADRDVERKQQQREARQPWPEDGRRVRLRLHIVHEHLLRPAHHLAAAVAGEPLEGLAAVGRHRVLTGIGHDEAELLGLHGLPVGELNDLDAIRPELLRLE